MSKTDGNFGKPLEPRVIPRIHTSFHQHLNLLVQRDAGVNFTFSHSCGRGYAHTVGTRVASPHPCVTPTLTFYHLTQRRAPPMSFPERHFTFAALSATQIYPFCATFDPASFIRSRPFDDVSASLLQAPVCRNDPQPPRELRLVCSGPLFQHRQ